MITDVTELAKSFQRQPEIAQLRTRAEAAELELSQERFMRQAAEAEVARLREQIADAVAQMPREEQDDLVSVQDVLEVICGITGPLVGGSLWFAAGEWEEIVGKAAEADELREEVATLTAELAERSAEYMALVERTADW